MAKPLVSDGRRCSPNGGSGIDDRKALGIRAPERHPLGDAAQGDGMRLGHDLLAPSERVA